MAESASRPSSSTADGASVSHAPPSLSMPAGRASSTAFPSSASTSRRRCTSTGAGNLWTDLALPFTASINDFDVNNKEEDVHKMEKWRRSSLVLNSARRFRYTADLESKSQPLPLLHASLLPPGLQAAQDSSLPVAQAEGFSYGTVALRQLVEGADSKALERMGGVQGVARGLGTDLVAGLSGSKDDLDRRVRVYGSNTYPEKPFKGFFSFVWDAMQDLTLMILAICATLSLVVGVATEGVAEGWYDGAGILLSILLVVSVTAVSDYRQALQFSELDREKKKVSMDVVRGGQRTRMSIYDIVVGDVIMLATGDVVPADGLFISGYSLVIDESSMTGESLPLQKNSEAPFLLSGTKVQDGNASMLAVGVGMNTEWGSLMAKLTDAGDDETPLQVKLNGVATLVGRLGLVVAVLVFIVLMGRQLANTDLAKWGMPDTLKVVDNFAVAVTIIVVAVPEGLPLAVTLSLAFAMKRMMSDKALVRKLAACETMGSATTICSDKTGTLTANQMTVVQAWLQGTVVATLTNSPQVRSTALFLSFPNPLVPSLLPFLPPPPSDHCSLHCNKSAADAVLPLPLSTLPPAPPLCVVAGEPVPSVHVGAAAVHLHQHHWRAMSRSERGVQVVRVDPFNSKRKRMAVVIKLPDGTHRVHWKGAAEIILGMCDTSIGKDGAAVPLSHSELDATILSFANSALRTLSVAYRDLKPSEVPANGVWTDETPVPDSGLTLLGVVGIKDPLRAGVAEAVRLCKSAGIKHVWAWVMCALVMCGRVVRVGWGRVCACMWVAWHQVRMVTGDNLNTGMAIARECGILTEGGEAIEGPKFRTLTRDQMKELLPRLQVRALPPSALIPCATPLILHFLSPHAMLPALLFPTCYASCPPLPTASHPITIFVLPSPPSLCPLASPYPTSPTTTCVMARSSPTDKHTMVNCLREMGEVVAVTGDGTNDAPALKEADIGLAMGIAGTEVAKESADVIIMDDNFSSIVNVAKWGRSVYTNIQKFVQFQLTVNIVALVTNFVSACITGSAPLTAVQLLWVNLIMDTLGALALATEPPTDSLMLKPPVGRRTPFISSIMWRNIAGQSVFQLALMAALQMYGDKMFGFTAVDKEGVLRLNTIIFNTFVLLPAKLVLVPLRACLAPAMLCREQVFNEINSRNMEALDVFSGILSNYVFVAIMPRHRLLPGRARAGPWQACLHCAALTARLAALCGAGRHCLPVAAVVKLIPVPARTASDALATTPAAVHAAAARRRACSSCPTRV
ncbi:unnamed protein product [Closterium sp. Naga37s-1]|nr:unnamed protein product [Closterium sp. Naga37s-1]